MSVDAVALLTRAADKLEKILAEVSPGPWAYNSYAAVFSVPKMHAYDAWLDSVDEGHTLERHGLCAPCGPVWRDPPPSPGLGHGCKMFVEDYRRDAVVASVPPIAGDSAHGCHAANAGYIEAMNPIVGHALVGLLRAEAGGMAATNGVPALLDTIASQNVGTTLRVSYSTVPHLAKVARAILGEPEPTTEEPSVD